MGAKVIHLTQAGTILEDLQGELRTGRLKGLITVAVLASDEPEDPIVSYACTDNLTYIDKLGLLTSALLTVEAVSQGGGGG